MHNVQAFRATHFRKMLCIVLMVYANNLFAQPLTVSNSQLSFGNVFENAPDSLQLTISNNTGRDVTVSNIRFYVTYGQPAFSTSTNYFTITNGASNTIWIKFAPRHNVFHNSEMVIENDGLRGYVSVDLRGQGKYSKTYYNLTENLEEENLKTMLKVVTGNGYTSLGYNVARDSMFMNIDNQKVNGQGAGQNTLECVYTGRQAVGYTSRTDCQTNHSFNTEHTFPQSFFNSQEPQRSDLHHLFPTDDNANNERADNPFGVVTNPSWNNGGSLSDGNTFEPRDEQKGVVARSLFYFVLRYSNYSNFVTSQESILRTWYDSFPPTAIDIKRNEDINTIQHNRNPFIDYPVFLERIHSITSNSSAPLFSSLDLPEDTIIFGHILTNTPTTYNYVVVNNGNIPVSLSNFALTHPAVMSFTGQSNDTTLAPGDGINVSITCNTPTSDSIRAFLTYNTNANGFPNISVPIFINDSVFTNIHEIENAFSVFPVPANDVIHINSKDMNLQWKLFSITGKLISSGNSKQADVSTLQSGLYIIKIGTSHQLVVVE